MVVLKENKLEADLAGGSLYGFVVEKIPENPLKQFYRWVKEKGKTETMKTLNEWLAGEADFQMQASEVKHGFTQKSEEFPQRRHDDGNGNRRGTDWKSGKSYGNWTTIRNRSLRHPTTIENRSLFHPMAKQNRKLAERVAKVIPF